MRIPLFLAILVVLVTAVSAFSQDERTRGAQFGLHGGVTSWTLGDIEGNEFGTETGYTFGGDFGWGMSDWLGIFTRAGWTTISPEDLESYQVFHFDIGIRAISHFFGHTIRPYFEALASVRDVNLIESNGFEISASGVGFGGGLGLYVFISRKIALTAGLDASFGKFDELTFAGIAIPSDVNATSARLIAGVTVFP